MHVTGLSVASCDFHHLETSLLCTLSLPPTSSTTDTNTTHSIIQTTRHRRLRCSAPHRPASPRCLHLHSASKPSNWLLRPNWVQGSVRFLFYASHLA